MRILFVLSQIEVTGAETYALTLALALRELGHKIILVSEKLRETGNFPFVSLPLHSKNTSYLGRIQNIVALRKIILEEDVELVHSHSRAANLVSHFALAGLRHVPLVVTVHGRWRNHFAARALPCLGKRTIAICPYLERYLSEDLGIPLGRICMIPNGINSTKFVPGDRAGNSELKILLVARFSGQKGKAIRFLLKNIFSDVLKKFAHATISILGGPAPEEDKALISQLNRELKRDAVRLLDSGFYSFQIYAQSSVVVGSGRVALEGMSCGRPVVAIGESSAPGLIRPENFARAFDSNFGDCGEWNLFEKENNLAADLAEVLKNQELSRSLGTWGREKIAEQFESKKVAKQVEEIYRGLTGMK